MKITGLETVIDDNSLHYIFFVIGGLIHADPKADMELHKNGNSINFVIIPSIQEFKSSIVKNMLDIHKLMGIKPSFCKSTALTTNIYFQINFDN